MENETNKPNPSEVALKVVTPVAKTREQLDDELRAEMTADLNSSFSSVAINEILANPAISKYVNMAKPMVPLLVGEIRKYLGKDKFRGMVYIDEETGALVFQKIETANIKTWDWHIEPQAKDFFIIEKKDLDNPEGFIKQMQKKFNFNIF